MAINLIDIGATANDGTGDPIRSAFNTVNSNFDFINGGLFAGTESSIISALSLTGGSVTSNSFVIANTYVNADSIVGNTVTSYGNLFVSKDGAYIVGNVNIIGNLSVSGSQAATQSASATSPIILIHANAAPYTLNDGKDIGLSWQYYDTTDKYGFLGRQNSTGSLVYLDNTTDTANVITAGTPGNVQFGSLLLSNTTSSTSNVTGALQVRGGVGIQGNIYVQSNIFIGNTANIGNITIRGFHVGSLNFAGADTIYINGSPVQTAAQAFNGGTVGLQTTFNATQDASSVSTGAVIVSGGIGVGGNIFASNIQVVTGGNVRANVQGNIFTAAQPFITSLGTLTGLSVQGQINSRNIVPETNLTYSLGTSTTTRWSKVWAFDADFSGATTLAGDLTSTANLNLNRSTVVGINTTTGTAEIFNNNATIVRIAGGGVAEFDSNIQSTSTSTGAIQLAGGMSIRTGNLFVGGSAGRAITHTGDIIPSANLSFNLGSPTAWYNTFYGVSTQAQYADLAEIYEADDTYEVGTVVVFGGDKEITVTSDFADHRIAGVISGQPAYLMNANATGLAVALRGRVPVRVTGPVNKGDLLVTSTTPGYARSVGSDTGFGIRIFAKSLEANFGNGTKIIEAVII